MPRLPRLLLAVAALVWAGVQAPAPLRAEGAQLDGLMAPELVFPDGLNGITRGTTLSSFRGKVVWIKFWLRDCPRCQKTLPDVQRLHELYAGSGLVVLTVVHSYLPDQVRPFLTQKGYTFPVGCDPTGTLAAAYQVNHRPTDYVVGAAGRVRSSNGAPLEVILSELAQLRVRELGRLPPGLEAVRAAVEAWDYAAAWKAAQAAAQAPEASDEVRAFAERFSALAQQRLEQRIETANAHWRRKELPEARELLEGLARAAQGTPFKTRTGEALEAFRAAVGG